MRSPWHYLSWSPPRLEWTSERRMAALVRRNGWIWAILLFWGVPDGNSGVAFGKLRLFVSYNYTGVLAGIAAWLTVQFGGDPGWGAIAAMVGLGWVITIIMGTTKYISWLVSLLNRWPPMGRA